MTSRTVDYGTPFSSPQKLSQFFGQNFSSDDIKKIAVEVLWQGSYDKACTAHPKGPWKFNFHPVNRRWLGSRTRMIRTLKDAVSKEYQELSRYFMERFTPDDIKEIAVEVLRKGVDYREACKTHPNGGWKFNFHPINGRWLGLSKENVMIRTLKGAVKKEYQELSRLFTRHFTHDDVKSIAERVHQLGNQRDRYVEACKNYQKPDCLYKFNFHHETGAWLGSSNENIVYGRLKKAVDDFRKHLLKKKVDEDQQVIVSTYTHLCDDTHTLTPHITLGYHRLGQGEQRLSGGSRCLEAQSCVTKNGPAKHNEKSQTDGKQTS